MRMAALYPPAGSPGPGAMILRAMADALPEPFLAVGDRLDLPIPLPAVIDPPPPAGFWRRALAVGLDGLFVLALISVANAACRILWGDAALRTRAFHAAWAAWLMVFPALYAALYHWLWGQTMGKMVVGARVVTRAGAPLSGRHSVLRALGWILSALALGLGFLMAALRRDKRGLADLVAGTRVDRV